MTFIIDRFEGEKAVLEGEGRRMSSVPRSALPAEAKEGDVLIRRDGRFFIDAEKTQERRRRLEEKRRALLKKFSPED